MAREFSRTRRIAEQIKRDLAELIRSEGDDARLAMVSITTVEVSRDLGYGKVYITYLGAAAERGEIVAELNRLAPLLRQRLGRQMHIRSVPSLTFIYDEIVEHGSQLSELITRTVAADAEKRQHSQEPDDTQ